MNLFTASTSNPAEESEESQRAPLQVISPLKTYCVFTPRQPVSHPTCFLSQNYSLIVEQLTSINLIEEVPSKRITPKTPISVDFWEDFLLAYTLAHHESLYMCEPWCISKEIFAVAGPAASWLANARPKPDTIDYFFACCCTPCRPNHKSKCQSNLLGDPPVKITRVPFPKFSEKKMTEILKTETWKSKVLQYIFMSIVLAQSGYPAVDRCAFKPDKKFYFITLDRQETITGQFMNWAGLKGNLKKSNKTASALGVTHPRKNCFQAPRLFDLSLNALFQ